MSERYLERLSEAIDAGAERTALQVLVTAAIVDRDLMRVHIEDLRELLNYYRELACVAEHVGNLGGPTPTHAECDAMNGTCGGSDGKE